MGLQSFHLTTVFSSHGRTLSGALSLGPEYPCSPLWPLGNQRWAQDSGSCLLPRRAVHLPSPTPPDFPAVRQGRVHGEHLLSYLMNKKTAAQKAPVTCWGPQSKLGAGLSGTQVSGPPGTCVLMREASAPLFHSSKGGALSCEC